MIRAIGARGTVNLRSSGRSPNHISLICHTRPGQSRRRTGENRPRIAQVDSAVLGTYRASLGVAQQRGEPLRVVLRLTAPQLAALPWEALFDPEIGAYLCRREPLVRHVPAPYTREPLEITPPLRVLGLVSSPRGPPALDVAAEQQHLPEALATLIAESLIELEWLAQGAQQHGAQPPVGQEACEHDERETREHAQEARVSF